MVQPPIDPRAAAVANRLHSAAIHLLRRLRTEDDVLGLTAPLASALSVVVFGGPITLGALARAEQVRPPTITRVVHQLERLGLVTREADSGDRRVQRVQATPKGRRVLEAGRARRAPSLAGAIAAMAPAELATLKAAADILERLLGRPAPPLPEREPET
jgi:DNA-binding MarR family transcriptional regulator